MPAKIPRRMTTAILQSLSAGVVPRIGLEYIAVGRKDEIATLLRDLDNVAEGAASFRFLVGRYGSGKSFILQFLRNYALDRGFVVADADLSPELHLSGSHGEGLATYRELMRNLSTKTNPDGGALPTLLARWISSIQLHVRQANNLPTESEDFARLVEGTILEVTGQMEGLVHGFDFGSVIAAFWQAYRKGDDELRGAVLRWLRGEFSTRTEARAALGVRVIIEDASWYDMVKVLARFVTLIGYKGLILLLDEAANLYKISHAVSRTTNYERLLSMFNDTMQGKAEHLGILLAGTNQFLEDPRRGLYSYEALRSRLAASRFAQAGHRDFSGPVIRLETLSPEEVYVLLRRVLEVYEVHYEDHREVGEEAVQAFLNAIVTRLGAQELLTPREVVRDWIAVLDLLRQNPQLALDQLLQGSDFHPTPPGKESSLEPSGSLPEFEL